MAPRPRGSTAAERRAEREREILLATRALFDERGVRDAQLHDVAKAVGINRAIIYRHFSGKEELFALTLVSYLEELEPQLAEVESTTTGGPADRLRAFTEVFVDYGIAHPAFVDCALALLRRPSDELAAEISEGAMQRLGRAVAGALRHLARLLAEGTADGTFAVADPDVTANLLYVQALGSMSLARSGVGARVVGGEGDAPATRQWFRLSPEQLRALTVDSAVAIAAGAGVAARG